MRQTILIAALVFVAISAAALAAEWPMWGGSPQRNMVNTVAKDIPASWDIETGRNVKWSARLGSQSYGNPVVAGGKILVGSNNEGKRLSNVVGDKGVILCFSASDGTFLWQMTHDKLPAGRVNDWPRQGICSSPAIDGDRFYYVSNRCELVCADLEGFQDGENDGPFQDEKLTGKNDGDIVWKLDMMDELGVFPHNLATSSPTYNEDLVFVCTSNGVDEGHIVLPDPFAPSFIAVDKRSGKVVWESSEPAEDVMHGQWSSPALGVMGGRPQVIFPGGDGKLYAFAPQTGKLLWSFQCNPPGTVWKMGGSGTRNNIIATPVIYADKTFISVGQDPEHGEGQGYLYAVSGTGQGDVSQSGIVWRNDEVQRSMSTVAIFDGVVYFCDLSGIVRALDLETGKTLWTHDVLAAVWSSPTVIDGKVYLGDEDGDVIVFQTGREKKVLFETNMGSAVYTTPIAVDGVLYIVNREQLFALAKGAKNDPAEVK